MFDVNELPALPAYEWAREQKHAFLTKELCELTRHHAQMCPEYARMLAAWGCDVDRVLSYEELPFLPVRLFKEFSLKSVPEEALHKTMKRICKSKWFRRSAIIIDN